MWGLPIHGGHPIPRANQACIACAYYYLDSRYYSNIEPSATSGLVGVGSIFGFPNFSAALTTGGVLMISLLVGRFRR